MAVRGVNLSGWLVLESWVTPAIFSGTGALDEVGLVSALGSDRYAEAVRNHRETFITEQDFAAIAARGFDAVRLPVPWYAFGDQGPLPGQFRGCITYVDRAFDWAEAHGLAILLDLGMVPGSGGSGDGPSQWDPDSAYRAASLQVVCALSRRYAGRASFLGIELLDEPRPLRHQGFSFVGSMPLHQLRNYYREAYDGVREAAGTGPVVVISDAGMPGSWRRFMAQGHYENVWLDCHLYHYADQMDASGPQGIRMLVDKSRHDLSLAQRSGLPVVVGEWSAALPLANSSMTPEGRVALERVYLAGQLAEFSRAEGWFFQTWKTTGRLSNWDARLAFASVERGMLD